MSDKVLQSRRSLARVGVAVSLVGLGLSLYLVWVSAFRSLPSFCEMGDTMSCARVLTSRWAFILKCPVSILGVSYFVIVTMLALYLAGPNHDDKDVGVSFFLSVLIGLAFSAYFVFAEYKIGSICLICTGVHVCVLILLPLSWKLYRLVAPAFKWTPESFADLIFSMKITVLVAILLVGTPIVAFQIFSIPDSKYAREDLERFGRCVAKSGMVVYTQEGCGYCEQQKKILGYAFPFMKNIHCTMENNMEECERDGIKTFPSWRRKAQSAYTKDISVGGMQGIDWIARFSGCQAPEPQY